MDIKLIIWDLDDTLWSGTLAEGEDVRLHQARADIIRKLNAHGVVSAICSKNDPEIGKQKLSEFDLWDQFVFPRLQFAPKALIIKQMIEDMQLRPINVLFVDNDAHNLEEARFLLPELNVVNAMHAECDAVLNQILEANKGNHKSRLADYRALEKRHIDREQKHLSSEDFLRSCGIHAAVVHRTDNMEFSERIEELINRSNQLNYTKSRVEPGSMVDLMATGDQNYGLSLFVWDKYGYHGLVGFAVLKGSRELTHFVFSCRIMNMGLESWFMNYIFKNMKSLDQSQPLPVQPAEVDWIQEDKFYDPDIRAMLWQKEKEKASAAIRLRIMSQCASGALAHYSGLGPIVDPDNTWKSFSLTEFLSDVLPGFGAMEMLVYGAVIDYDEKIWEKLGAENRYQECVLKFCDFVQANNKKLLVLLTPQNIPPHKQNVARRADEKRMAFCNDCWRSAAKSYERVSIVEAADFVATDDEIIDNYHYGVSLLKKLGEQVRIWFDAESVEEDMPVFQSFRKQVYR